MMTFSTLLFSAMLRSTPSFYPELIRLHSNSRLADPWHHKGVPQVRPRWAAFDRFRGQSYGDARGLLIVDLSWLLGWSRYP